MTPEEKLLHDIFGKPELDNACRCGDCYHPVVGPNTDGDPCDWCQDCGCPSADHARMTSPTPSVEVTRRARHEEST